MRSYGSRAVAKVKDPRATWHWRTKVRPVVLQRDRYVCQWNYPGICRGRATSVDHVVALAEGGAPYDLANLVAACGPCNSSRSPGGRRGWVKGQGMRNSHIYAPPVRIAQSVVLGTASSEGIAERKADRGRSLSGMGAARCGPRPSIHTKTRALGRLQAPTRAHGGLATDTVGLGGSPALSGYYGHRRGAADAGG
jgi:hypothetical protein